MANEQVRVTTETAEAMEDKVEDKNNSLQVEERRVVETDEAIPPTASSEDAIVASGTSQTHHPGWNILPAEELPKATYWPVVMALAITLVVFGVVTTVIISIVGLLLFVISLIGWIGDIQDEHHEHH